MRNPMPWLLVALVALVGCGDDAGKKTKDKAAKDGAEKTAAPNVTAADLPAPADPLLARGREVWLGTCQPCHGTGLGGAPLIGNRALWAPRIAQGIDALYGHALKGFAGKAGEMPPRGGNDKLGDDDVKAAVSFMVSVGK